MNQITHPTKEQVRQWLKEQIGMHRPPPSPVQIRRELDWHVTPICNARMASAK